MHSEYFIENYELTSEIFTYNNINIMKFLS